jgi:hypothetical protein
VLLILGIVLCGNINTWAVEPKPGDVIDASNIEQYKDYFPMFIERYIKDGWGFEKPMVVKVREADPVPFTKGYMEASKKNMATTKLTSEGLLEGYSGQGCPFLEPKEPNMGTKLMWNQFYKSFPDDWFIPGYYISFSKRKGGNVIVGDTRYEQLMFSNRTMVNPMPEIENPKQLYYANRLVSLTPPNKDLDTLTWRYKDPMKYDDMWTYIPTLRRALRLVSSERANPIQGTPYTWDDIFGFDGKIPFFTYEIIGEQTVLNLVHQKIKCEEIDRKTWPWHPVLHQGEEYETVPSYIIEIKSKDPRYPYTRKTVWMDKKKFNVIYAQMYDKNNDFWKGFWNGGQVRMVKTTYGEEPFAIQCSSGITDFKTQYWIGTITGGLEMNKGGDPSYFTPGALTLGR